MKISEKRDGSREHPFYTVQEAIDHIEANKDNPIYRTMPVYVGRPKESWWKRFLTKMLVNQSKP